MKKIIIPIFICSCLIANLFAQRQLDIQGKSATADTVATIKTNYSGPGELVGLAVTATSGNMGTAGHFNGSAIGIKGFSWSGYGIIGETFGGRAIYGSSTQGTGIYGISDTGRGIYGMSYQNTAIYGDGRDSIGVYGTSESSVGVYGYSADTIGVLGESQKHGIYGKTNVFKGRSVTGLAIGENSIGLMGLAPSVNGTGVWGSGSLYNFYAAGSGVDYGSASSIRWKENIRPITDPVKKIAALRGVYFDWNAEHGGRINNLGMIAEEVGQILPEIVVFEENGIDAMGMDYGKLAPVLIEAVKAQQKMIEDLQKENNIILNKLSEMNKILAKMTGVAKNKPSYTE